MCEGWESLQEVVLQILIYNSLSGLEGIIISHTNLIPQNLKETGIIGKLIFVEQVNVMWLLLVNCCVKEAQVLSYSLFISQSYCSVMKDMELDRQ